MKLSQLQLDAPVWVEIPDSDAIQHVSSDNRQRYIDSYGDVEVVWNFELGYYVVPDFAESRKRYSQSKAEHCAIWGCE